MNYEKKLVILSGRSAKGTALIERNGMGNFVTLSTFSLPDLGVGEYALGVKTDKVVFRRETGSLGRIKARFALPDGDYSNVHLALFRTYDEEVVLYGTTDSHRLWEANVMDGLRGDKREKKKNTYAVATAAATEFSYSPKKIEDYFLDIDPSGYADSAIAEENYFKYSSRDELKGGAEERLLRVLGEERRKREDDEDETETESSPEDETPVKKEKENGSGNGTEIRLGKLDENAARYAATRVKTHASYYSSVKPRIDKLFSSCERFTPLENALPDTRWVKVDYDGSGRYYTVGLIGSAPDYIAYAVPGKMTSPALDGADFVPTDPGSPTDGFWVLFQSAQTGREIVKD